MSAICFVPGVYSIFRRFRDTISSDFSSRSLQTFSIQAASFAPLFVIIISVSIIFCEIFFCFIIAQEVVPFPLIII
jgi:hypothetical protein